MSTRTLEKLQTSQIAEDWIADLERAWVEADPSLLTPLFTETPLWRDLMVFTWDYTNYVGADEVHTAFATFIPSAGVTSVTPVTDQAAVAQQGAILAFFDFVSASGVHKGHARLVQDEQGEWRAAVLLTQLEQHATVHDPDTETRPEGKVHGAVPGRKDWKAERLEEAAFSDEDPSVVVVGSGHNGLSIAAQLRQLGVSTLVIDRNARVGDNWRNRYTSLALHSGLGADHLPFIPFPATWTAHTPKDKLGDFLESYAMLLDLNVWTSSELTQATFDEASARWEIAVRRADGSVRVMHPAHLVLATGLNGAPVVPAVPGLETFEGVAVHAGEFQGGADWSGKRVLVVGAGVSGHDSAQELYEHGAQVTMLQRSATYVVNWDTFQNLWWGSHAEGSPLTTEYADMTAYSIPMRATDDMHRALVKIALEQDSELLTKLKDRGFKITLGPREGGLFDLHLSGIDGYYMNIGASDLIADGEIALKQGVELTRVEGKTVVFSDGSTEEFDLILFATGYQPVRHVVSRLLGDEVATKLGNVYTPLDEAGEFNQAWRPTRQQGLWFATGFVSSARYYSKFMAQAIAAIQKGVPVIE